MNVEITSLSTHIWNGYSSHEIRKHEQRVSAIQAAMDKFAEFNTKRNTVLPTGVDIYVAHDDGQSIVIDVTYSYDFYGWREQRETFYAAQSIVTELVDDDESYHYHAIMIES